MFLHKSVKDGGNIGPSLHLMHCRDRTRLGISIHGFNHEVAIGFGFAIFCLLFQFSCFPRWVKTESRFKGSFSLDKIRG